MKPALVLGLVAVAIAATFFVLLEPVEPVDPGRNTLGPSITEQPLTPSGQTSRPELSVSEIDRVQATAGQEPARALVDGQGEFTGSFDNAIAGLVVDAEDRPIAGAVMTLIKHRVSTQFAPIEAVLSRQDGKPRQTWRDTSDEAGKFRFTSLEPGADYTVVAEHEGFSVTERSNFRVDAVGEVLVMVKMRKGYTLVGTVMDDRTGQPIADAQLKLMSVFSLLPGASQDGGLEALTGPDGRFELANVPAGTRNLTVTAPGYGSRTRNNLLFAGSTLEEVTQDFRLDQGRCLRGRVLAPDMTPIAGAEVEATSYETAQVSRGKTLTDQDGNFEICDLAEGTFMVITRAAGFSPDRKTRVMLTDPDLQIVMSRQGGVIGNVVARADGAPVTSFKAMVRMVAPGSTVYGRTVSQGQFENAEGRFELGGLEPGTYVIQAEAEDFAPTYSSNFVVSQGIVTAHVKVELGQGGALSGRVVDNRTGEPLSGAVVQTYDNGYIENPFSDILGGLVPRTTTERKVRTDADGNFLIEQLAVATYQIQVEHGDYPHTVLKDLQVNEGKTTELGSIRLVQGATVRGVVYDAAGAPLADARISVNTNKHGTVYPQQVRSDAQGRFVVTNLEPGPWTISAVRPDSDAAGNPFGPIIDMKKSEVSIVVSSGQQVTQNLTIGD